MRDRWEGAKQNETPAPSGQRKKIEKRRKPDNLLSNFSLFANYSHPILLHFALVFRTSLLKQPIYRWTRNWKDAQILFKIPRRKSAHAGLLGHCCTETTALVERVQGDVSSAGEIRS